MMTLMLTIMMTIMMMTMKEIMVTTMMTTMLTMMITLISGARAIRDEVHKDYEVASEDEQLQLLPRNPLCPRLSTNKTPR